ncbi:MAG: hypothetical protein JXB07_13610 [Anaerolineae bacterium]|nr:hypothetical protein [Anaerolineae bacterium]
MAQEAIGQVSINGQDFSPETKSARVIINHKGLEPLPNLIEIIVIASGIASI